MRVLVLSTVIAAVALGCGASSDDAEDELKEQALALDGAETSNASSQSGALGRASFSGVDAQAQDANEAEKRFHVLGNLSLVSSFLPAGCARLVPLPAIEQDGVKHPHARIEFDGCTGPYGLAKLTGAIETTLTLPTPGAPVRKWHLEIGVPDGVTLMSRGRPLTYTASADVVVDADGRELTWHAAWSGTTKSGKAVSHTSDMNVRTDADTRCTDMSGVTTGKVEDRGIDTIVDGVTVCPGACPTSGTIQSIAKNGKKSVVIRFDGSSTAHVTGRKGRTFELPLACADGT